LPANGYSMLKSARLASLMRMADEELERALIERVQTRGLLERAQKLGFADVGETQNEVSDDLST
jgi:hypothetical protein